MSPANPTSLPVQSAGMLLSHSSSLHRTSPFSCAVRPPTTAASLPSAAGGGLYPSERIVRGSGEPRLVPANIALSFGVGRQARRDGAKLDDGPVGQRRAERGDPPSPQHLGSARKRHFGQGVNNPTYAVRSPGPMTMLESASRNVEFQLPAVCSVDCQRCAVFGCHSRGNRRGAPRRSAPGHLGRIHQPDAPPALRQQPRPRRRHLRLAVRVRVAARRRTPAPPAVEPQTGTRAVQHHRRNPPAALTVVLARVQEDVRQRPANLRRRALQHVVEASRENAPLAAEDQPAATPAFTQRANRAARLFMPFASRRAPAASIRKCAWSSCTE